MAFSACVFTFRRSFITHSRYYAAEKKFGKGTVVDEPEPIRDTQLLCSRCCGLNKFIDGEDPILKPDSEYPDWLWTIYTGKPKRFGDYSPDSREYWQSLARLKLSLKNKPKKGITYYKKPKTHQTKFVSRLSPKK